jgi:hypothetical protein
MSDDPEVPEWMNRQLEGVVNDSRRALIDWEQKFTLSVAVGNGAGLVVLGGALINGWKLNLFLPILPAMWCFGLGLVLAGLAPFISMRGYSHGYRGTLAQLGDYLGQPVNDYVAMDDGTTPEHNIKQAARHDRIAMNLGLASGAAFISGVAWPLTIVTFFGAFVGPR